MESLIFVLSIVILMCFSCSSQAYKFYVGGKNGWVSKPSEDYNHWAERNRFQVNDTLVFRYRKGHNSVLVVDKDAYYKCNKKRPLQALKDGVSEFKLDRSGPFYFISGHAHKCRKGQKLIVVVMAVRKGNHTLPNTPRVDTPPPSLSPAVSPQPAPAPTPSAAAEFGGSVALGVGAGLVLLGSFVGMF